MTCPDDTDGDGNCGRPLCPHCGTGPDAERARELAARASRPAGLYWLSFVDPAKSAPPGEQTPGTGGFLGAAIVRAADPIDAVRRAWELGLNPGGEVAIIGPGPDDAFPAELIERQTLLTAEEAQAL